MKTPRTDKLIKSLESKPNLVAYIKMTDHAADLEKEGQFVTDLLVAGGKVSKKDVAAAKRIAANTRR